MPPAAFSIPDERPAADPGHAANRRNFGFAHAARSAGWAIVDLLLAWHLHAKLGLSGQQVAWTMCGLLTLGGIANLVVGTLLTRHGTPIRGLIHLQAIGAIGAAVTLAGQFSTATVPAAIAVGVAFRIFYAAQDVPQNALLSLLPADDADAAGYARLRGVLSGAARLAVTGVNVIVAYQSVTIGSNGQLAALLLVGAAIVASALNLYRLHWTTAVRERRPVRRPDVADGPDGLPRLLLLFVLSTLFLPTLGRLLVFAPAGVALPNLGAWLLLLSCLGAAIGPIVQRRIDIAADVRTADWTAALAIVGSSVGFAVGGSTVLLLACAVVHGLAIGALGVRLWAAASALAMADARRIGWRRDGTVFGAVIFCVHLSTAAGLLLLGPLIDDYAAGMPVAGLWAAAISSASALVLVAMLTRRTAPATASPPPRSQPNRLRPRAPRL